MRRLLLALILAVAPVAVDARTVTFETVPSGARVVMHTEWTHDDVGASGTPVELQVPQGGTLRVTLEKPGHRTVAEVLTMPAGDAPVVFGPFVLEADNALIAAQDVAVEHPLAAAAGVALAVGALALLRTRQRRGREALDRSLTLGRLRDASDPMVGRRLDRWRLSRVLGRGGMGRVYEAFPDATLDAGEAVAIKVLDADQARDPEFRERFVRETDTVRRLSHPAIVRLVDWGDADGLLYMVMELVPGTSLRDRVRPGGLAPEEVLDVLRPVFEGLDHAHRAGVTHRDLKPENVMLTGLGRAKVMDFGLARRRENRVTRTGSVLGTPGYMAPEQIRGGEPDGRTDQYALGVMAYELLCGRLPVEGLDEMALMFHHASEDPLPSLGAARKDLPAGLVAVVDRMLRKRMDERFATMREALDAFTAEVATKQ